MEISNKNKNILLITVLIACSTIALVAYFAFQVFDNYKEEQRKIELEKEQGNLEKELKEKLLDQELADLRQQILDLKNKPIETKTITNTVTVAAKDTIADIVKEWSPRVVHIECSWVYQNGSSAKASGSAMIVKFTGLGLKAITSKHIIIDKNNFAPKECKIELLDGNVYSILINKDNISAGLNEDWAYVSLPTDEILSNITKQNVKLCPSVEVGDKLLILGYPKIGSKTGLTVTDGIVSGFDKSYYITSAKIDKGNSGGAAILVKDDCYLGTPSNSVVGVIESLGRILKASFVITN